MIHINRYALIPIFSVIFLLTGCATIVSRSIWPVYVKADPDGSKLLVKNKKGLEVYNGTTPAVIHLRSGAGYFGKESYTLTFTMDGYESKTVNLECTINGWYFGNILLGGILGMLVVDPATGAMYRPERLDVYEYLKTKGVSVNDPQHSLLVVSKNKIPAALWQQLQRL